MGEELACGVRRTCGVVRGLQQDHPTGEDELSWRTVGKRGWAGHGEDHRAENVWRVSCSWLSLLAACRRSLSIQGGCLIFLVGLGKELLCL